jgi:hypothetical protein
MASRSLYEHIASDADIARYTAHAQRLLRYQRHLEAVLPPALRSHTRVANLRAGKLVIYASNASVAAKVRNCAPRLAEVFATEGTKLSEIDVRVQPLLDTPIHQAPVPKPLPSAARQRALNELADKLPTDSALREPLKRLLGTLKGR